MKRENLYLLDNEELMKISDLCEGLGLAVDKIIRARRLIREDGFCHPAVKGYEDLVHEALVDDDILKNLF